MTPDKFRLCSVCALELSARGSVASWMGWGWTKIGPICRRKHLIEQQFDGRAMRDQQRKRPVPVDDLSWKENLCRRFVFSLKRLVVKFCFGWFLCRRMGTLNLNVLFKQKKLLLLRNHWSFRVKTQRVTDMGQRGESAAWQAKCKKRTFT